MTKIVLLLVMMILLLSIELVYSLINNKMLCVSSSSLLMTSTMISSKTSSCLLMTSTTISSKARITAIIPNIGKGHLKYSPFVVKPPKGSDCGVDWVEVMTHIGKKLIHEGSDEPLKVITSDSIDEINNLKTDILMLIGLDDNVEIFKDASNNAAATIVFNCSQNLYSLETYGEFIPSNNKLCDQIIEVYDNFVKNDRSQHRKMYDISQELWARNSGDDWRFMMLVLIDTFTDLSIKSVKSTTSTENTQLSQFQCMLGNCKDELIECFKDPECRAALDCLNKCRGNDQVCSYRCITSHETKAFEKFALCILQKNNCMNNTATMPTYPDPKPMTSFRNVPLTHELAEQIFIGHLQPRDGEKNILCPSENEKWSWKVVCGQNPAYDYFNEQHQLFYYDSQRTSSMWYDPVFKVTTLDGVDVWRRRHYKVRRGTVPGTFYFSVLDNGVTSQEYWRIVDCSDDMSWAVFYYSGFAAAAGTSYSGSLLVTKDGNWPTDNRLSRIYDAFSTFDIKPWELFEVSNVEDLKAGPAPLGYR